ncbi:hypothetical protein B0H21DRAFT_19182 [Amylocystis lapponica]|nr:hypothetical protein B0H21DRAFT_19182 [Amylocystis lapponica]
MSLLYPPEITDQIIDCLRDDIESLQACARVCHVWLPRSRHHLFSYIQISRVSTLQKLVHLSHVPHMVPYFTSLRILRLIEDEFRCLSVAPGGPFVHSAPPLLQTVVSTVKVLYISCVNWMKGVPQADFFPAIAHFSSLESLVLDHCVFSSFRDVQHLLCALPALSKLKLARMTQWVTVGDARKIREPERPRLTVLDIEDCWEKETSDLFEWLLGTPSRQTLRTLKLATSVEEEETHRFISALGPSLEHLEIHYHGGLKRILNLEQCVALRTLRLGFYTSNNGAYDLVKVASFLTRTTCHFSVLHLDIRIRALQQLEQHAGDWWLIDEVLASPQYAHLQMAAITWMLYKYDYRVHEPPAFADVCRSLERQLPGLSKCGILGVQVREWEIGIPQAP